MVRACGLGVVKLNGLKLWPIRPSSVFTLEFHRGLPSGLWVREGRERRFPVGVADPCLDDPGDGEAWGAGAAMVERRLVLPFRGIWFVFDGMLTFLLAPGWGRPLLAFDRALPFCTGVICSGPVSAVMTTEEAGELPGVS